MIVSNTINYQRLAKEHTCIAHGHRQQCGEGGGWVHVGRGGRWGISVTVSTIKKEYIDKLKNNKIPRNKFTRGGKRLVLGKS